MFLKKALPGVLGVAAIVAILVNPPGARTADAQHLSGSYYIQVFLDAPLPPGPFTGLVTYTIDGTAIANEIITPFAGPALTEDHGGWERIGNRKFAVSFVKLASSGGTFVNFIKNRATIELSPDAEQFSGRFRTDVLLPDGVTVVFSAPGTITGKRIPVEPFPG